MSAQPSEKHDVRIEDSKQWQLAARIVVKVREAVRFVPNEEHYTFSNAAVQNATLTVSDIAYAVGKNMQDNSFDWRFARGHLFTAKSLVLVAEQLQFVKIPNDLLADFDKLHTLIEAEIDKADSVSKEKTKG